jgi:hypothetical protein
MLRRGLGIIKNQVVIITPTDSEVGSGQVYGTTPPRRL